MNSPPPGARETRHANQAALEVGDEEEHVQRQAEIDAPLAGKLHLPTPRDLVHLVESCDDSDADFEIAARLDETAIAIDVVRVRIFEGKSRAAG